MYGITSIKLNDIGKNPMLRPMFRLVPFLTNLSKEFAMARYAQPEFLNLSPKPAEAIKAAVPGSEVMSEGSKTLAGMLLAASLASLLVVADQVINTWSDGHLLAGWVALWTVAFAALAFMATPLRRISTMASRGLSAWWAAGKVRRQEEAMWEFARRDPRVMADLQAAITRQNG